MFFFLFFFCFFLVGGGGEIVSLFSHNTMLKGPVCHFFSKEAWLIAISDLLARLLLCRFNTTESNVPPDCYSILIESLLNCTG